MCSESSHGPQVELGQWSLQKFWKDLFYDKDIIVIGVGIQKRATKLQMDFGIMWMDPCLFNDGIIKSNTFYYLFLFL